MELEVKHVASYLPYDLRILDKENGIIRKLVVNNYSISSLEDIGFDNVFLKNENHLRRNRKKENFKLILRPLSDLTKEIEFKGRMIVPSLAICKGRDIIYENKSFWYYKIESIVNDKKGWIGAEKQLELFEKLFEWHFDVYGLIEAGLAIDINDINK